MIGKEREVLRAIEWVKASRGPQLPLFSCCPLSVLCFDMLLQALPLLRVWRLSLCDNSIDSSIGYMEEVHPSTNSESSWYRQQHFIGFCTANIPVGLFPYSAGLRRWLAERDFAQCTTAHSAIAERLQGLCIFTGALAPWVGLYRIFVAPKHEVCHFPMLDPRQQPEDRKDEKRATRQTKKIIKGKHLTVPLLALHTFARNKEDQCKCRMLACTTEAENRARELSSSTSTMRSAMRSSSAIAWDRTFYAGLACTSPVMREHMLLGHCIQILHA
jgi:hypothetical protein